MAKLDQSASLEELMEQFRMVASEVQSAYHQLEQELLMGDDHEWETADATEGMELPNLAPLHLMGTLVSGLSQATMVVNQDLLIVSANTEAQKSFRLDGKTSLVDVVAPKIVEQMQGAIDEAGSRPGLEMKLLEGGSAGVYDCIYLDNPIEKGRLLLLVAQDLELDHMREVQDQILKNLTGTLVHEIRTPLTSMQGFAELLMQVQDLDPDESNKIQFIRHGIDRLNVLASTLGTVFREVVEPHWIKMNLNGFLTEIVTAFAAGNDLPDDVIELSLLQEDVQLVTDPEMLREVFQRLLENGIEAVGEPSTGDLAVSAFKEGEEVVISFGDRGPGPGDSDTEEWWVPFYTTKSGHLGLGLVQVRRSMEILGGTATLAAPPSGGMAVILTLPL